MLAKHLFYDRVGSPSLIFGFVLFYGGAEMGSTPESPFCLDRLLQLQFMANPTYPNLWLQGDIPSMRGGDFQTTRMMYSLGWTNRMQRL